MTTTASPASECRGGLGPAGRARSETARATQKPANVTLMAQGHPCVPVGWKWVPGECELWVQVTCRPQLPGGKEARTSHLR